MTEESLVEFQIREGQPEQFIAADYTIKDEADALWAMRNLAVAERGIAETERLAKIEEQRIRSWVEYATKSQRASRDFFAAALKSFMLRLREEEGRKSLVFPDGELTSRTTQTRAVVDDVDLFLKWAETSSHEDWVRVKKEPNLAAMKGGLEFIGQAVLDQATGEVIEGLGYVEGGVSVTIALSE